jgi:phytoene synthase
VPAGFFGNLSLIPAAAASMNPEEYCRQKAVAGGSSLHYSLLFLAPEKRAALTALLAFCREVEGVVDECSDARVARTKLAWWRLEVGRLFEGKPNHPVTNALLPFTGIFQSGADRLNQVIDGIEMDLAQTRYLDFAGLKRYCEQTTGAAAAAATEILGYRNALSLEYAGHLGIAVRLAKIIRDVGADARRNRIYLPMDEMKQFDVPAADILQMKHSGNFTKLMAFQAHRASAMFDAAIRSLPLEDRSAQRPGLIMAAICRATLAEVEQDGFRVLSHRTSLTPLRKLWLAWKTWVSN